MITQEPTKEVFEQWKVVWMKYKDKLQPNRKSGVELLNYLQSKYALTEIYDKKATDAIIGNVTMNAHYAEKLPKGAIPIPKAFFLESSGNGKHFYRPENKDPLDLWGGDITRIFVGIDIASGFYMVEGSTMLWDELCAFQGVDEKDLQNYVCAAEYIHSLKRFGKLETVVAE
ncbi:MAG: hypothetical protein LKK39_08120 [Oscillospiraceae bacterium]|jgi:hypothetical protein|nr:hypothetical protein [Oscillospiraceae bacterium]MCI2191519.1 hypothetical protein [Oscillospiraceae bacterium]MCI2206408.1 hypothetical protein [Oscillospiraceae bacterium]